MTFDIFGKYKKELALKDGQLAELTKQLEEAKGNVKDNSELLADRDNLFNELQALKEKEATFNKDLTALKEAHTLELTSKEDAITKLQGEIVQLNEAHAKDVEAVKATKEQEIVDASIKIVASQGINVPTIESNIAQLPTLTKAEAIAKLNTLQGDERSKFYSDYKDVIWS